MDNIESRFDRQERIHLWNQNKLKESSVSIVDNSFISKFLAINLISLGINIIIYTENEKLYSDLAFQKLLNKIDSNVILEIYNKSNDTDNQILNFFKLGCDLIIDSIPSDDYSLGNKSIYILQEDSDIRIIYNLAYSGLNLNKIKSLKQDSINILDSALIASIIADEISKKILQEISPNTVDLLTVPINSINLDLLNNKKILIVGAGALGNIVAYLLSHFSNLEIDIIDFDNIEITNLNRQFLFAGNVGKSKSRTLSYILRKLNKQNKIKSIHKPFDGKGRKKYDVIFDCVDNFKVRRVIDAHAKKINSILISGGTGVNALQVYSYIPKLKKCLNCAYQLDELIKEETERASCVLNVNPSVITTNQIAGSLMIIELCKILNNIITEGVIMYDSEEEKRMGVIQKSCSKKPCVCKN